MGIAWLGGPDAVRIGDKCGCIHSDAVLTRVQPESGTNAYDAVLLLECLEFCWYRTQILELCSMVGVEQTPLLLGEM